MKIISFFTGTRDPKVNRKAAAVALVVFAVLVLLATLRFVFQVSAAGPESVEPLLPTAPTAPAVTEPVQSGTEPPSDENAALREALAAAEAERDALREQLSASDTEASRLRSELEALRREQSTVYVLRFRVERSVRFSNGCEVITFTRTVDKAEYDLWEPGDSITDHAGFLSVPGDGFLHNWTVTLEDKYITRDTP